MTTNFTIRDFFVFLLTGALFITAIGLVLFDNIKDYTFLYDIYKVIKNNSLVSSFFLIPCIYFIGHIIGSISYFGHIFSNKVKDVCGEKCKWLVYIIETLFNKSKINFAISEYYSDRIPNDKLQTTNIFWADCAKLQIQKIYEPAAYWYHISEFFDSLYYMFVVVAIISIIFLKPFFTIIYLVLAIVCYFRAKQHAANFVKTVNRLLEAQKLIEESNKK